MGIMCEYATSSDHKLHKLQMKLKISDRIIVNLAQICLHPPGLLVPVDREIPRKRSWKNFANHD
jgi:hypothetical protein